MLRHCGDFSACSTNQCCKVYNSMPLQALAKCFDQMMGKIVRNIPIPAIYIRYNKRLVILRKAWHMSIVLAVSEERMAIP